MPSFETDFDLHDFGDWPATVAQMREVVYRLGISAAVMQSDDMPARMRRCIPTESEINMLTEEAQDAFKAGRVIEFGLLPNSVISETANRAGPLYLQGYLPLPFRDPWMFAHGYEKTMAWYLVNPMEERTIEIAEIIALRIRSTHCAVVGDRALLIPGRAEGDWRCYPCDVIPAPHRYLFPDNERMNGKQSPEAAAAGNVLDPFVTALMILNTNNVRRETITADAKLQRARAKNNKPLIPPYDVVHSAPWVTAIGTKSSGVKAEHKGGSHASPVPHLRRGHLRHHADGKRSMIRDSLVNFNAEAKAAFQGRSHYTVQS